MEMSSVPTAPECHVVPAVNRTVFARKSFLITALSHQPASSVFQVPTADNMINVTQEPQGLLGATSTIRAELARSRLASVPATSDRNQ